MSCAGDELDGAGGVVADRLRQRDRLRAHLLARRLVEQRRRRLLDDLLVAALDRAFALAEMDDVAVLVAQHLDFDVARVLDVFLDEHAVVAERALRLRARADKAFRDLGFVVRDPQALAAAAGRRLDHHRIADLGGDLLRLRLVGDLALIARHGRDLGLGGGLLGRDLVAHGVDGVGVGPDEHDAGLGERARKRRPLGEEAVARMHRLGAGRAAGSDDRLDRQIALGRGRRADPHRLVGHLDVQRVLVGVGIDRHGRDAEPARGLDDPAGDFAAIGDQDALEHSARAKVAAQCRGLSAIVNRRARTAMPATAPPDAAAAARRRHQRDVEREAASPQAGADDAACSPYCWRPPPGSQARRPAG